METKIFSRPQVEMPLSTKADQVKSSERVESHPAWLGELSLSEVTNLLDGHKPGTYALTKGQKADFYILSHVTWDDYSVSHQEFNRTENGTWYTANSMDCEQPTLPLITRKIMHILNESQKNPIPYNRYNEKREG